MTNAQIDELIRLLQWYYVTTFLQPILDPALRLQKFCLDEQERAQARSPTGPRTPQAQAQARQEFLSLKASFLRKDTDHDQRAD